MIEKLLSEKVDRMEPRPGFAGRVLARLPSDAERRPGIAGALAGALAAGAAAAALLALAMLLFGDPNEQPGLAADAAADADVRLTAEPWPDGGAAVEALSRLTSMAASWPVHPLEDGLRTESEAFRRDVENVGAFLVRTVPRFPEAPPADS